MRPFDVSRVRLAIGLLVACVAPHCAGSHTARGTPSRRGESVVAFVGVTVLPLDTTATLSDQTVLVRGERIERVGASASVTVPPGARVVEGHGRFLMPGLMDMHVHLGRAQDLSIMLALGVTTVRNMWGAPIHVEWRERIARGEMQGPTIFTAGPILDGENPVHPGSLIVRTEADVERAIALHGRLGYDFVKVLSGLSPAVFDRVVAEASRQRFAVAGHVPWAVSLDHAVSVGMRSIEHMTGFVAALQAADSPLAGRIDFASRARQIDHVDESRIEPLARQLAALHVFDVPTRGVMDSWRSAADVRAMLAQPEMRWLPPWERVLAEPGPDDPEDLDRSRRRVALYDRMLRALDQAGGFIATGTDLENPLVIPGFSLHHEIELLAGAGLSPLAALQAATRRGAELIGRASEVGRVAPGMRADLLLLDANPLEDVHNTRRIAGVMARGRHLDRAALDTILAQIAAEFAGPQDSFRGAPVLAVDGELQFRAEYEITWRDVHFGGERIAVGRRGEDETVAFESFEPHEGEAVRGQWHAGSARNGASLTLDADGATGRGHLDVRREGDRINVRGTSLPGIDVTFAHAIPADTLLAPATLLSSVVLWRQRLQGLAVGGSIEVREQDVGLGSEVDWSERSLQVRRLDDRALDGSANSTRVTVFEIAGPRGRPAQLFLDAGGWPLAIVTQVHGATLRLQRRPGVTR